MVDLNKLSPAALGAAMTHVHFGAEPVQVYAIKVA